MDSFRVLARLILVEDAQQFRINPPPMTRVHVRMQGAATESAHRVDYDEVEGSVRAFGFVNQLLEDLTVVIERQRAGLREGLDDVPALSIAVGIAIGEMNAKRAVTLGLTRYRDADVYPSVPQGA